MPYDSSQGLLVPLLILLAAAWPAAVQSQHADVNRWAFTVAPNLLIPSMRGDVTVGGHPVEVDVGSGDIFKNLDFGAMVYLEASNQDWAFSLVQQIRLTSL
jgi:hypothetical protein